jgi:hypothetical protein
MSTTDTDTDTDTTDGVVLECTFYPFDADDRMVREVVLGGTDAVILIEGVQEDPDDDLVFRVAANGLTGDALAGILRLIAAGLEQGVET